MKKAGISCTTPCPTPFLIELSQKSSLSRSTPLSFEVVLCSVVKNDLEVLGSYYPLLQSTDQLGMWVQHCHWLLWLFNFNLWTCTATATASSAYLWRFCSSHFCLLFRDSPPHVPVRELSTGSVIEVITNMTVTVQNLFPNLQVFPALGNHDYWPQVKLTSASKSA